MFTNHQPRDGDEQAEYTQRCTDRETVLKTKLAAASAPTQVDQNTAAHGIDKTRDDHAAHPHGDESNNDDDHAAHPHGDESNNDDADDSDL